MTYRERQEAEIKTIKERTVTIELSDADCERIATKAGKHGLTVGELLKNFIGDLVCGTYSNGSDERDYADQWFERCWFGMFPDNTLLKHLLDWDHDVEDFMAAWDEKEYYKEHPEEFEEYMADLEEDEKPWWDEHIEDILEDWKPEKEEVDMVEEIRRCRNWLDDLVNLKGE